ncbi:hypothetical protein A0H81_11900 [Grifola frondosa]|uniref:THO1-MOS11 C-terminal domain-containing protein n=1 Tax=Grifola frondosa TaxID=5627 RepID=A0A1C7LVW9_GRIFR|nr:hypothetical protein A0H81_11900 [Grifola frondosa]
MESKLKALKVVDLKDILSKANVAIQGKANKQDLIAKILASSAAVDVYNTLHGTADSSPPSKKPSPSSVTNTVSSQPSPPPADSTVAPDTTTADTPSDTYRRPIRDVHRLSRPAIRSKRASASTVPAAPKPKATKAAPKLSSGASPDDAERLKARAARFAASQPAAAPQTRAPVTKPAQSNGRKRAAPPAEPVDAEELERRRKRAQRFGIAPVEAKV